MDFDSIFNRAPSTGLSATGAIYTPMDGWTEYLSNIAYGGRTVASARRAKEVRDAMSRHLARLRADDPMENIFSVVQILDMHQAQALIDELDRFIVSRVNPIDSRKKDVVAMLRDFVEVDLKNIELDTINTFYDDIAMYESDLVGSGAAFTPPGRRNAKQKDVVEYSYDRINVVFLRFKASEARTVPKYEAKKSELKRKVPAHLHRLIDIVVELFVYDTYKFGLLYIRSNYPGAIGAFNGIE